MRIRLRKYWEREDGFAATTTAMIMAGIAVAGTAVSAYGSIAQAGAQKQAADFNAKVANNNARATELQSMQDADNLRSRNQRLRGTQIANMAAAGVASTGSGADVMYDSSVQSELDRLTTLYKGKIQGNAYRSQSQLDTAEGSNAQSAGWLSAGGTILSGAGTSLYDYSSIANNPRFNRYGVE